VLAQLFAERVGGNEELTIVNVLEAAATPKKAREPIQLTSP
jgi:hypothetical protein